MAGSFQKDFVQDFRKDMRVRNGGAILYTGNENANTLTITLFDNGEPYAGGGTITGTAVRQDGRTVPLTGGSITGNVASVTLNQNCYNVPGMLGVYVDLVTSNATTTILSVIYSVVETATNETVDPSGEITISVTDLINQINQAVATVPPVANQLMAALAPTYDQITFPIDAGVQHCWYDGKFYVNTVDIASSESWTAAHWQETDVDESLADLHEAVETLTAGVDGLQDMVLIQTTQPTSDSNRVWIPTTQGEEVQVPTYAEHQDVVEDVDSLKSAFEVLDDAISTLSTQKANIDGSYASLTAGNAEQLISTVGVEDKVPYNFRTSGGGVDVGDRMTEKVVGGTIAWNQLVPSNATAVTRNGITYTPNSDGSVTADGTADGDSYFNSTGELKIDGHKVLIIGCPSGGSDSTYYIRNGYSVQNYDTGSGVLINVNTHVLVQISIRSGVTVSNLKFKPQIFDLTQMFGSTIADYVYGLETSTAGAGVAWFKKLFPNDYYAYNAGELMSVQAASHVTTGFNQWDGVWEVGGYNDQGLPNSSTNRIRSKNYIPVVPSANYYGKCPDGFRLYLYYYDANKTFISGGGYIANGAFTIPGNARYMQFYSWKGGWTDYSNHGDICISLAYDGSRNGEYEPYVKHEYPLDSTLTLRGVPKLDADNRLYYDGDTYEGDGTVTRRYGVVDLGTLDWVIESVTPGQARATKTNAAVTLMKYPGYLVCQKYTMQYSAEYNTLEDKCISVTNSQANQYLRIRDSSLEGLDAAAFKAAMSGVMLVYELATPITETAAPYQNPQIVDDFGTEEYVDGGVTADPPTRDVSIPVGHETFYQANLRAKLESAPNSPDGNGDYIVRQSNGQNSYVPLSFPADELPAAPTDNGTYVLKCTVSGGAATYTWEAQT